MGAHLSGGKTNAKAVIRYSSLQVSTSLLDVPVTLFWGQRRISPNCIWYNNFKSHPANKGGKGGNKGGQYTYTASVITALCEGVVGEPLNVWGPSSTTTTTTLSALGAGIFATGTATQTPWAFVTGEYPAQARSYMNTVYVGFEDLNLGESAAVPDYAYELQRLCGFTDTLSAPGWTNPATGGNTAGKDCSLADIIPDFLTNPSYGLGLAATDIGNVAFFRSYQDAQGLYFSPLLTSQEKATAILDRWAKLANSWIFWDGTQIRFVPLGDSALSANGATYTPDLAAAYALGPADFVAKKGETPVEVTRADPADCFNRTRLEIADRVRSYVSNPIEWKDQYLVDRFGVRDGSSVEATDICNPAVGAICAQLIGKRAAYVRNIYKFRLSYKYILLLPGSIVTLSEPNIGLSAFPVRVRTIEEDEEGVLSVLAEELPAGIGTYYSGTVPPSVVATTVNTNVDPGPVNTPGVCEPNSSFGGSVVLIAASGGANWGGCNVLVSLDGTDFTQAGVITSPALQGTLTAALAAYSGANPDTTDLVSVDATQSEGVFPAATDTLAQNLVTLAYLSPQPSSAGGYEVLNAGGELLAFGAVAATGTYTANLSYLERGLYGTSGIAHAVGEQFTLFDLSGQLGTTLNLPLAANWIGKTIYLKFQSFNVFDGALEDVSTLATYAFTPTGSSFGSGSGGVPSMPTDFAGIVGSTQVILSWNANPAADNVTGYAVYRANGTSALFASAALIWSGNALSFTDTNVDLVTGYTYFLVAINQVGDSNPTAGFSTTTGGLTNGQVLQIYGQSNLTGLAEISVDFNPQVLACNVLEITVARVVLATAGASLILLARSGGADITTASYDWEYVQAAYGASPSGGGTAGDSAIHLANQLYTALNSDEAFGRIDLQLIGGVYPKFSYRFTGTYNPSGNKASGWTGTAQFDSTVTAITGLTLKASTGNIVSATLAIRGYQM